MEKQLKKAIADLEKSGCGVVEPEPWQQSEAHPVTCRWCNGSGEGQAGKWRCTHCKGFGEVTVNKGELG